MCCSYMLRVCGCVFCLFLFCLYICVCVYLQIKGPLRECRSIRTGASGLPYYCAPLVCVPGVIGLLAVWRHNKPKTKKPKLVLTGSEIHLILECPATSHVALDLIQFLTTFFYDTCQLDWTTLTTHQQTSLILGG